MSIVPKQNFESIEDQQLCIRLCRDNFLFGGSLLPQLGVQDF
jgi:hypothetical protein